MPFTDPMADGPTIQAAALRALKAGHRLSKTLAMVRDFRRDDDATPIVLMGYYNPIYVYGVDRFLADAKEAGVDGLIVVDLPPEEDRELCVPALEAGLNFIRLATPTTDDARLPAVLKNTSGFVYYVSVNGITGSAIPDYSRVASSVQRIKRHTDLPVAVGFGVKTPEGAAEVAAHADAVVVGTALIDVLARSLDGGQATPTTVDAVRGFVEGLARGVRSAKRPSARGAGGPAVSWINNVVPPKIRSFLITKKDTPENLWVKCPDSGQLVFHKDLENNLFVVPGSDFHMKMDARTRLATTFDDGTVGRDPGRRGPVRPAALPRREALRRQAQGGPHQDRPQRRREARLRQARRARRRGGGADLRLHGRLARHGGGRGHRDGRRARAEAEGALHPLRGLRGRPHARGHVTPSCRCPAPRWR